MRGFRSSHSGTLLERSRHHPNGTGTRNKKWSGQGFPTEAENLRLLLKRWQRVPTSIEELSRSSKATEIQRPTPGGRRSDSRERAPATHVEESNSWRPTGRERLQGTENHFPHPGRAKIQSPSPAGLPLRDRPGWEGCEGMISRLLRPRCQQLWIPLPLASNFISLCNEQYGNKHGCHVDVPCCLLSTKINRVAELFSETSTLTYSLIRCQIPDCYNQMNWKEEGRKRFCLTVKYYPEICLNWPRKSTKLSKYNRSPDMNLVPRDCWLIEMDSH